MTEKDFIDLIHAHLEKGHDPKVQIENINQDNEEIRKKKEKIIAELSPNKEMEYFMRVIGTIVWAKPHRKDLQSRGYYYIQEGLLKELMRRLELSKQEILSIPYEMLADFMIKGIDKDKINEIYKCHVVVPQENGIDVLYADEAKAFKKNMKLIKAEIPKVSDQIKGTLASVGKAKGKVKIINSPEDMHKMEFGDILVSVATTPSIVSAMNKASAIVTDEGGITCHAAIVSRELKIPCVVSTFVATKFLKDGDIVEVNADNGIVRRIDENGK